MKNRSDEYYIQKTIQLARKGIGRVNPNPLVGSIIVKNGEIVGKGYHHCFGKDHAEVVALKDAGENARDATMYVNLEPCCHHGKTPPCTDAIIKAGIKRVVIGMVDPNPLVNQQGIKTLMNHGIEVTYGVEQAACEELNKVFVKYITQKLPYVTLKIAQSLDGRIATRTGHSQWITSEPARKLAHQLRAKNDAVLVGIGTVLADDPQLSVRLAKGRNPSRIILDSQLKIPLDSNLLTDRLVHKTIIVTVSEDSQKIRQIEALGARVWQLESNVEGKVSLLALMKEISRNDMSAVMVEGGSKIITSFLRERLADHIIVVVAPKILGSGIEAIGDLGIRIVDKGILLKNLQTRKLGDDFLIEGDLEYCNETGIH